MRTHPMRLPKILLVLVFGSIFLTGCGAIEGFLNGVQAACNAPELVVTKTADTDDGLCTASDCSLREAVVMANNCPGVQTIRIPAGTYLLTRAGAGEDAASTGDLDITFDVHIIGDGNPVIDANHLDRAFDIMEKVTVDMTGVIIQNGQSSDGGGIRTKGPLTLTSSIVRQNTATLPADVTTGSGGGGGILSETFGSLDLHSVQVLANTAYAGGGVAVYANGTTFPTFDAADSHFNDNTAAQSGGGLWLDNQVTADITTFEINNNTATNDRGDGIYNAATLALGTGSIDTNRGGIYGGGIYNEPAGTVTLSMVNMQHNLARFGGGLYNKGAVHIFESALIDNGAERGQGGGIFNKDSDAALTIENSTLSTNSATAGGAIWNDGGGFQINYATIAENTPNGIESTGPGVIQIHNSILANLGNVNCAGTLPASLGFNIDSGATCGFASGGDLAHTDPLLEPLALNGGPTATYALAPASPAVNSADPALCVPTDQRGTGRPQGSACDRGAFELDAADIVSPTATSTVTPTILPSPTTAATETPAATIAGLGFDRLSLSTTALFYYGTCSPQDVKFQIGVIDPAKEANVLLFVQLRDAVSGVLTGWNSGSAMSPIGNGLFWLDLPSSTIPAYNTYPKATLEYQFVATDKNQKVVFRSPVYQDIVLSQCNKK